MSEQESTNQQLPGDAETRGVVSEVVMPLAIAGTGGIGGGVGKVVGEHFVAKFTKPKEQPEGK
jgi:proteasome assembly chaperone (PAC2) family protein